MCRLTYFTQQQAPPAQPGQASQVQTPVSQQPQSQTQQQAPWQQPSAQPAAALGDAEENNEASKKISEYIRNLQVERANSNQTEKPV
jgi:hypothetical protein